MSILRGLAGTIVVTGLLLTLVGCDKAKEAASKATETAKQAATSAVDGAKDAASDVAEKAGDMASGAVDTAKNAATEAADKAGDMASGAVDTAKSAASDAVNAATDAAEKAGDMASGAVAGATNAVAESGYKKLLSEANSVRTSAIDSGAAWKNTGKLLEKAEAAATGGDFAKASSLVANAKMQSEAALKQFAANEGAGPRF